MNLEGKKLKKDWEKLAKTPREDYGEDYDGELLITTESDTIENECFENGVFQYAISNDYGYFAVDIDIDDDLIFEMIDYLAKKGKKIKQLLNLVGE